MVLSKKDATAAAAARDASPLRELEEQIDLKITERTDSTRSVRVYVDAFGLARTAMEELAAKYREGGWNVSFGNDMIEGDYIRLI